MDLSKYLETLPIANEETREKLEKVGKPFIEEVNFFKERCTICGDLVDTKSFRIYVPSKREEVHFKKYHYNKKTNEEKYNLLKECRENFINKLKENHPAKIIEYVIEMFNEGAKYLLFEPEKMIDLFARGKELANKYPLSRDALKIDYLVKFIA